MSTTPATPDLSTVQQELNTGVVAGAAIADQFIHSQDGKAQEAKGVAIAQLGIAALPVLSDLFHAFGNLLSHLHKSSTAKS